MTELVKDKERGLLVPPGDVDALAEAMLWMVKHPAEAKQMGTVAREYAFQVHSANEHYEKIMTIYQEVLN